MMNNRLVITLLHKKHCWFVLSRFSCSTKSTHIHTADSALHGLHGTSITLLTIWGLPLPPALLVLGLHVTVAGLNKRVSTIHYTQKSSSNLFYAYLLVKNLSFADTQTILSSVFVASLTDLWSSYEFEAAAICPVFYCECLSLIDISSVFVILY